LGLSRGSANTGVGVSRGSANTGVDMDRVGVSTDDKGVSTGKVWAL
jgi:hypothetical protein